MRKGWDSGFGVTEPLLDSAQPTETKREFWLRGVDLNHRPLGYEPNELPDCSTPRIDDNNRCQRRQTSTSMKGSVRADEAHSRLRLITRFGDFDAGLSTALSVLPSASPAFTD